jgi:predicted GNAT family acetyltransferase
MKTYTGTHKICFMDDDGTIAAEIDFPLQAPGIVTINHTVVDPRLRGQHIADKLMTQAVNHIRKSHWKAYVTCTYAQAWCKRHPDKVSDILLSEEPIK